MEQLTAMELDRIAEASDICMAHSVTALSMMTGKEVVIKSPVAKMMNRADVKNLMMAFGVGSVAVQIDSKDNFKFNNLLLFKDDAVKIIMDLMMGGAGTAAEGELNEMHISCVSEVMNQMMGASVIALTEMIDTMVDINPPNATQVKAQEDIDKINLLPFADEILAVILIHFEAAGVYKGIMLRVYPMKEARYICDNFKAK